MILCVVHREADSQLSLDTDFEDPDVKNAKTGKGVVCFSNMMSSYVHTCQSVIRVTGKLEFIPAWASLVWFPE